MDATAGRTRILVTHAVHLLPQVDYIFTVVDGRIAERGTYPELLTNDGAFARFAREFGAKEEQEEEEEDAIALEGLDTKKARAALESPATGGKPLMQAEERSTGAVSGKVYKEYLKAGKGPIIIPLLLMALVFMQATQVMSSYWYVTCCQ